VRFNVLKALSLMLSLLTPVLALVLTFTVYVTVHGAGTFMRPQLTVIATATHTCP
jgi:hypothetical protein